MNFTLKELIDECEKAIPIYRDIAEDEGMSGDVDAYEMYDKEAIQLEKLIKDAGIIYTIVEFKKGYRLYNKKQLYFGPCLLKNSNSLFFEKCNLELNKMKQFYPMIPKNHWHHKLKIYWKIKNLEKILSKR